MPPPTTPQSNTLFKYFQRTPKSQANEDGGDKDKTPKSVKTNGNNDDGNNPCSSSAVKTNNNTGNKSLSTPTTSSNNLTTPKSRNTDTKKRRTSDPLSAGEERKKRRAESPGLFDCEFKEGSVVWAKLEGFPWWTAMVRPELPGGPISRKQKSEFHVQFFDDPPSRAWIRQIDLKLYEGSHDGKVPPSKYNSTWVAACKEADSALNISPKKRLDKFWVHFDIEGKEDGDMDSVEEMEEEEVQPTPKSRDKKPKARKRLLVIESSDDENEKRERSSSPVSRNNKKETISSRNAKKTNNKTANSEDSDEEYEPSPTKDNGVEESEETEESIVDDSDVTTPDEDSDVEMISEKKSVIKKMGNGRKAPQESTPARKEVKSNVKARLAQFTPTGTNSNGGNFRPNTPAIMGQQSTTLSEEKAQNWPHLKLDFLKPDKIMDNHKRKPSDPNYNPRTLFIPSSFLDKTTPGMRQWWLLKTQNFDTVLFFKVGKFYEFYHMDAVIAAEELSIMYMKGDYAHSGFPEASFSRYSSQLIEKGYKIARIEQTETPEMMTKRCNKIKPTKFDRVVNREICQISTRGVRYASFQDDSRSNPFSPESTFLFGIVEEVQSGSTIKFGVCFVDTTIGDFYISQFTDDRHHSRFRTLMSHHTPVQILFEKGKLCSATLQMLNNYSGVRKDSLSHQEFWDSKQVLKYLAEQDFFMDKTSGNLVWPDAFDTVAEGVGQLKTPNSNWELGLKGLGGVVWYLKHCLLDHDLLSLKKFHIYHPVDAVTAESTTNDVNRKSRPKFMVLDGITLRNLDITEGPKNLISIINRCHTHFGKRLLREWVCMPLAIPEEISNRLDAVEELMSLVELREEFIPKLKSLPDLERLLNKVHYLGSSHRSKNHPEGRAIFFMETKYSKNKIYDMTNILRGFKTCRKIIDIFSEKEIDVKSELLASLIENFPDMTDLLKHFDTAFDHNAAIKEGKIIPKEGVDKEYDDCKAAVIEIEAQANAYLKVVSKELGARAVYFGNEKKRFQLEVPDGTRVSRDFELSSSKKGYKRYINDKTKSFVAAILNAEAKREEVLRDITRRIFEKFDQHREIWKAGVDSIALLDALLSLAEFSESQEDMVRPKIVYSDVPYICIQDGRHPCMPPDVYIPNSCNLGSNTKSVTTQHGSFILLTGPNMGGKSTLMRQVGLLAVLAHIGCHVPASLCEMSVIDRIFTRLGANDNIGEGESTFFVEMSETSAILKHSTQDSLILMDELGRGTATYDGTAIAYAVSNALVSKASRTIFSTHYHTLVDSLENTPSVQLGHVACMVENENEDDPTQETITFLYKMSSGACPKSYGFNAARLAGIPDDVVRAAHRKAKEFEASVNKVDLFRKIVGGLKKLTLGSVKSMGLV